MKLDAKLMVGLAVVIAVGVVLGGVLTTKFGSQLGIDSYEV